MSNNDAWIERALAVLTQRVLAESVLRDEFARARAEFFASPLAVAAHVSPIAERRFAEWFLLERPSERLGGTPIVVWAHELVEHGVLESSVVNALRNSFCGVFEVTTVVADEGAWIRDLLTGGAFPLVDQQGSRALEVQDVLIGRLFDLGGTGHWLSRSAAFFRSEKLLRALERDMESARGKRRGVLRLSQREVEQMFWNAEGVIEGRPVDGAGAVERARTWFAERGIAPERVEVFLLELREAPLESGPILVGAHDALGSILERLAFDTEIDLELARGVLLAAWVELRTPPHDGAADEELAETPTLDPRSALESFDRGREAGRDLEALFRDLERDLGLEPDDDNADDAVPDFPGVVGAMVEEFLWETGRERGESALAPLQSLRRFAEFGADIGVFENLSERDLLIFASVWLPERGSLADADDARSTLAALGEFCAWAEDRHGVNLRSAFEARLPELAQSLARVTEVNRCLAGAPREGGSIHEVLELDGAVRLRDAHGREHRANFDGAIARWLAVGDRLRGSLSADGRFALFRCYPPESAEILGAV